MRRAARVGDGWFGWELDLEETAGAIADLNEASRQIARGRDLEVTLAPKPPFTLESPVEFGLAGVDRLVLQPSGFAGSEIDDLIDLAAENLIGRVPPATADS